MVLELYLGSRLKDNNYVLLSFILKWLPFNQNIWIKASHMGSEKVRLCCYTPCSTAQQS